MKSWTSSLPALTLAFGVACLSAAGYVFTRGFDPTVTGVVGEDGAAAVNVTLPTPLVRDPGIGQAAQMTTRPDGLRELSVVAPGEVLLEDQRRGLIKHLSEVKLSLNVPDAMSYHARREGKLMVLSGASAPGTGFFLFSERPGAKLIGNPSKFLREYFKGAIELKPDDHNQPFLSRFAGELTWVKGEATGGQRFDAFVIKAAKKGGFAHLLFIFDPTVANATRRLMVDSIKPVR